MAEHEKDLENGDPKRERISFADGCELIPGSLLCECRDSQILGDPDKDEGEYANLIRYISTYRDRRFSKAPSQVSGEDGADATQKKKLPFYKRWFTQGNGPEELTLFPKNG